METCNLDHSQEDVIQKLENQKDFLPARLYQDLQNFLKNEHPQQTLNELFHLFKKYDLATKDEQDERNQKLIQLISAL